MVKELIKGMFLLIVTVIYICIFSYLIMLIHNSAILTALCVVLAMVVLVVIMEVYDYF